MQRVEQLDFLSLISSFKLNSIHIPRLIERLMLREVLHLLLFLRPRSVQPVLHFLRDLLQTLRLLAHDLRQRKHLHMHMALHRNSLSVALSLVSHPEKAVIYVRKVHVHLALVVIAADFPCKPFELHRRVVQIHRFAAFSLPLAQLLDNERETGRSRQQNVLSSHSTQKTTSNTGRPVRLANSCERCSDSAIEFGSIVHTLRDCGAFGTEEDADGTRVVLELL